jgi:hypothetical protein
VAILAWAKVPFGIYGLAAHATDWPAGCHDLLPVSGKGTHLDGSGPKVRYRRSRIVFLVYHLIGDQHQIATGLIHPKIDPSRTERGLQGVFQIHSLLDNRIWIDDSIGVIVR